MSWAGHVQGQAGRLGLASWQEGPKECSSLKADGYSGGVTSSRGN